MANYINNLGQIRLGWRTAVSTTPVNTNDVDATSFITAAGITDSTQISALNTLVNDLKTYGLWTKMKALYPFVGGSAASHKFNLKDPRDLDAAFRLVFNGGLTHDSSGITLNGTTGYVDTRMNANSTNFNYSSQHLSLYSRKNTDGSYVDMGVQTGGGKRFIEFCIRLNGNFYGALFYNDTNGGADYLTYTNNDSRGFYTFNRPSNTIVSIFNNSTKVSTRTQTSSNTMFSEKPLFIGGMNGFPVAGGYTNRQYAFSSIGDGLTDTEVSNFYTSVQKFQTTLGRHVGTPYVSDPDAIAFLMAAGITDGNQAAAINTLVIRMKADGVWTKMKAVYPFVGGTAFSHKFNLKDPRDLDAAYRLVFNGGWTHSSTGATPNGTTGYANTFLSPNSRLNLTSNHFSYYSRSNVAAAQQIEMGVADNLAETPLIAFSIRFTGDIYRYFNPDYNVTNISTSNTDSRGFYVGSRTANNSHKTFKNGTQQGVNTTTITQSTLPSSNLYIGVYNFAPGVPAAYSSKEAAFASIGDGLTDTEAANLYSAVQAYQTTLGRQTDVPLVSDTDAQSFLNAANITSFQQASAVNKLVVDLKAAGVWSKMKAIYPFVGGSAASHKFNLKDPRDLDAAYRLVFNGGWTHTGTGALPNGTTGWADTKLSPSTTLTQWNTHISYYSRTSTRQSSSIDMGSADGLAVNLFCLTLPRTTGGGGSCQYSQTNASEMASFSGLTDASGFWLSSRTSNIGNTHKASRNGIILATASTSAGNLVSQTIKIACLEANYLSNKETCFNSIGDGLTDAESTAFYNAVQTYQTSLGRQVTTPIYNNGLVLNLDAGNANSYPGIGTSWFDLASGNNGTLVNGVTYDNTNSGGLTLNGSNQYINISSLNNTNLNFTTSDKFTISCYFKATSTPSTFLGLVVSGNTSGEWNYGIWVTNGKIQVGTHNDGRYGNSTIVAGQIYQVTLTYSNNTMIIYLNGVNDGTFTSVSLFNGLNQQLVIGRKGANAGWYFPGTIYNVQIYNRSLSATEILNNFNSSRGRFGL